MIRIFVTGGTFDKTYDEIEGALAFGDTHLNEMLRLGRCEVEVSVAARFAIPGSSDRSKTRYTAEKSSNRRSLISGPSCTNTSICCAMICR